MDNNELLMIVLAFVVGYMASGMMKQMCGQRLVEGLKCGFPNIGTGTISCSGWGCNGDSDCDDYDPTNNPNTCVGYTGGGYSGTCN